MGWSEGRLYSRQMAVNSDVVTSAVRGEPFSPVAGETEDCVCSFWKPERKL